MKKTLFLFLLSAALMLILAGCGKAPAPVTESSTPETATPAAESQSAVIETPAPSSVPGRQDGERFEDVIILEGMEETVKYEHVVNKTLGIEMDYDYESFVRRCEADRERFVSVWDNAANPENWLEVTYSAESAETAAASVREALSLEYDLLEDTRTLDRAGDCLRIEASVIKGTNNMAPQIQTVYIIPAPDGCLIATAHCAIEASEGFGRRFAYMLNTLSVISR
ncbi:MAG: hypothetical protein IJV30_10340 [Oscillospiraceae bacterium]|nr:hypothetical protein [Oscillospiraceae bacterium]